MRVEIALFRGINVGGHGKLPMSELRVILKQLGARLPRTYIQSGNAAYVGQLDPEAIANAVEAARGFRRPVWVLTLDELTRVIAENPFAEAVDDPKSLHVFLLQDASTARQSDLDAEAAPEERCVLSGQVIYLHTPKYLSGSRLATRVDRIVGVPTTARNWRSILAIRDMAETLVRDAESA
jgi:uncharacterized protein (DUF1697 family)